jgi:outer membrane protein OmpA-like peptidoglycan-associated protein
MIARSRSHGVTPVCLLALLAGCAGNELASRARDVRGVIKAARDAGAYRCAPRELAIAESHVDFAERDLDQGDYFRAKDHLQVADSNARQALRLSPPERCQQSRATSGDSDGDGVPDRSDRCPAEPEDRDGFEDGDGCPEPDNDKDGLIDARDKCPNDAEDMDGFADDDGCPDPDNDEDGVLDAQDKCPREKEDRDGFEDGDGCPEPDNDKDGYLDAADKCPNEAGPQGGDGCPQRYKFISVTAEKIELRQTIFFQSTKAVIMSKSYPLLDEVATALKARPAIKVRIEGHTDSRGNRALNTRLSQARADSVKAYLVGKGVEADRLDAKGFGPDQPIETNKTAAGRDKNRRVEFVITEQ